MLDHIVKTIEVPCSQKMAFEVFVDINSWWSLDKRSMASKSGANPLSVSLVPKVGGQIIEHGDDGTEHLWGSVKVFDPFDRFSMTFHMGLPPCDSVVEVVFTPLSESKTQVVLTQSNWEAFGDMAEMMRGGYGGSWGLLFEEAYKNACSA